MDYEQALADSNLALMEQVEVSNQLRKQVDALESERDRLKTALEEMQARMGTVMTAQVHQWRRKGCADWYDGYPDDHDGGGPYETRILYNFTPSTTN